MGDIFSVEFIEEGKEHCFSVFTFTNQCPSVPMPDDEVEVNGELYMVIRRVFHFNVNPLIKRNEHEVTIYVSKIEK